MCLTVSVFVAGLGGYGVESNGNTQEDFDSMEKETLVTKLKQVGFSLQLDVTYSRFTTADGFVKLVRP